jgi:FkbM family methyltransferase
MASRRQMMLLLVIALAYKFYSIHLRYIAASLLIFDRKFYSSTWLSGSNVDATSTLAKSKNTTANTSTSENSSDAASTMISIHRPKSCTAEQIKRIYERLPDYEDYCRTGKDPWINNCPISIITGCPETTWLDEHYISVSDPQLQKKFLAINVGCNKGYDAIHFLRMGSMNPVFAKKTWSDAMPRDTMGPNCAQNTESDILSSSNSMPTGTNLIHGGMRVYCIEPMPSTFQALQNASNITGWAENLKIIHAAINNEDPSSLLFPKPSIDNLGYEKHTIGTGCPETGEGCVPVETKRLDDLIRDENLLGQRVHVLLIDVEGYDFEVLLGGNITLHATEYVEFEFNWRGKVSAKGIAILLSSSSIKGAERMIAKNMHTHIPKNDSLIGNSGENTFNRVNNHSSPQFHT